MTKIAGIINLTPDSFSGDGCANDVILQYAKEMISAGIDYIDVGAESTRPGATPLTQVEEWQRIERFLPQLVTYAHQHNTRVSVDTRHAETARQALSINIDMVNDVNGIKAPDMLDTLAAATCDIVFMHSLTIPANPNITMNKDEDVISTLIEFAQTTVKRAEALGIKRERLIFDPGIGFNKTAEQSMEILKRIDELKSIGLPLYVGHSRKSFLNYYCPMPADQRDGLTLAVSQYLMAHKVDYLRVHNVKQHKALTAIHRDLYAC